jgi:hypothetical protein
MQGKVKQMFLKSIQFTEALLDVKRRVERTACTRFLGFTSRFCGIDVIDRSELRAYAEFSITDRYIQISLRNEQARSCACFRQPQ